METSESKAKQQEKEHRENVLTILVILFVTGVLTFIPSLISYFAK